MANKDERGSGGTADGYCMIDPVILNGVINDLATMESAITAEIKGLKAEFEKVGVSAGPVNDLVNVSHWLHGELPMLRRRHAAAVLLESQGMQFYPGTRMLAMPEDPTLAAKQAGELAAQRVRDGLDAKPPSQDGIVDAVKALQQIIARKGRLSPDDLAFLQAVYGGLGRTIYRVPGQLGDDEAAKSTVVSGLLVLSNDKLGGGFDKLPAEIRQDLRDTGWRHWNSLGDKASDPLRGDGFPALARFLLTRDPGSKIAPGDEFATGLGRSLLDNIRLQQWLKQEYSNVAPPPEMAQTALLTTAEDQQFLGLIAGSHQAAASLMSDKLGVRLLLKHDWEDKGAAVAGLTDWAAKAAMDPSSPEYVMAKRATADLINAVTVNGSLDDKNAPDYQMFKQSLEWLKARPEIAQAFSKLIAANFADFGAGEPSQTTGPGDDQHLRISTDQRHRFAMLASTDPEARVMLKLASEAYKAEVLANPSYEDAKSVGFIDAMIRSAGHNAVFYEHMNEADAENKALAAARADDATVKSVANYVFGQAGGVIPGKVASVGSWVLGKIIDEGYMPIPGDEPVLPMPVNTNVDATGVDVAENQAAYDLATARLRADPDGASTAELPPEFFKHGADGRPHPKDATEMTDADKVQLQKWAMKTAGTAYLDTYAGTFRDYYGFAQNLKGGMPDYVGAPSR